MIRASQAEPGCRYEMILTTLTGLVRYRMHDILECTGFYRAYPKAGLSIQGCIVRNRRVHIDFPRTTRSASCSSRDSLCGTMSCWAPTLPGKAFALYIKEGIGSRADRRDLRPRSVARHGNTTGRAARAAVVAAVQTVVTPGITPDVGAGGPTRRRKTDTCLRKPLTT